jgi:hypothetical protein
VRTAKFAALGAMLLGTAVFSATTPAGAAVSVNVQAGPVAVAVAGECDDYYAPPWGYPSNYCDYEIWDEPVYVGGVWYRGPIYWRMDNDVRVFWINGRWHRHAWVGPLPVSFAWGRQGFVSWHGKSFHGKHVWRFGSRHNWRGRHRGHGHNGHGRRDRGQHGKGHGHGHGQGHGH